MRRRVALPRRAWVRVACAVACVLAASGASAQRVYKCTSGRTVLYSHEPCLDAQVVDVTPTQGMNRSSGVSRKGADVQRIETRTMLANAMKPLTGMDEPQLKKLGERQRLAPSARQECDRLDARLAQEEAQTAQAVGEVDRQARAARVFESRGRYRGLGC